MSYKKFGKVSVMSHTHEMYILWFHLSTCFSDSLTAEENNQVYNYQIIVTLPPCLVDALSSITAVVSLNVNLHVVPSI